MFVLEILAFSIIPSLSLRLSRFFSLFDKPDNNLKTHKNIIPYSGGLIVLLSSILYLIIYGFNLPLFCCIVISLLGLIDDKYGLSISIRLLGELGISGILVNHFYGFENLYLFLPLVIFGGLLINAANFIDIKDGLLTSYFICFVIATLNADLIRDQNFLNYLFFMAISFVYFFFKNVKPAKTYLGDGGAYAFGIIMFILFLQAFDLDKTLSYENILNLFRLSNVYIAIDSINFKRCIFLLAYVPILYEFYFVFLRRLYKKLNPLKGSKDHIAILLEKKGYSVYKINFLFSLAPLSSFIFFIAVNKSIGIQPLILLSIYSIIFITKFFIDKSN